MAPAVEIALPVQSQLGEGPVWLERTQELLWVDIASGVVQSWRPLTQERRSTRFAGEASAVIPCDDGSFLVAVGHDVFSLEQIGASGESCPVLASFETGVSDNRLNDCRCDPQGRLWLGTMSKSRTPGTAGLYCLTAGKAPELVVAGTTLSNGIAWSPDGALMYFIDSTTQRIDVFDFDGAVGALSGRRRLVEIDPADGMPDGMAVDAEGGLWVCLFGGGAVRRYGPDGELEEHVSVPVPHPTCPVFGGDDLSTIFLTTTRHRLTSEQAAAFPEAGSVFALHAGVRGRPATPYRRQSVAP